MTYRNVIVLSSLAAALSAQVRDVPAGKPKNQDYIVSFRSGTGADERGRALQQAGGQARFHYAIVDAVAVRVPDDNALAALQRHPQVEAVVPDRPVSAIHTSTARPDDAGNQGNGKGNGNGNGNGNSSGNGPETVPEGVKRVGIPRPGSDGTGIGVAILDTGMDYNHADLAVAEPRFDAFGGDCLDNDGHGTHVAGIVAARQGNKTGVVGVAPNAVLYCVKVLGDDGYGWDSTIMAGLDWVYANRTAYNIRVVNMSLGRFGSVDDNPFLRVSVQNLYNAGVVVVVAAGNDAAKAVSEQVPASYPEVFTVASTTAADGDDQCHLLTLKIKKDTASYFTSGGALSAHRIGVTISAPGEETEDLGKDCLIHSAGIVSLKPGGGTTRISGTSMAAPHVTGVVARIFQIAPAMTPEAIRSAIRGTATGIGAAPFDSPTATYTFDGEREGVVTAP